MRYADASVIAAPHPITAWYRRVSSTSITETRERIAAIVKPLDLSKINEHPEPDGWSVGQVLEHLCNADERYETPLADLLKRSPKDPGAPAREWKPSFIGGKIAESLLKPKK